MDEQIDFYSVCLMSRMLCVSRARYYKWKNGSISEREKRRKILQAAVLETYHLLKKRYGAPRITQELNSLGIFCSLNHVANLLQDLGLKVHNGKNFRYRFADGTMTNVCENLLNRDFKAQRPNQKWSGDITYINANGKWMYLAVVMDLYSRAIAGIMPWWSHSLVDSKSNAYTRVDIHQ